MFLMNKIILCLFCFAVSVVNSNDSVAMEKFDTDMYITDHPGSELVFQQKQFYIFTYSDSRTPKNLKPNLLQTKNSIARIKNAYRKFIQFVNFYSDSIVSKHILSKSIAIRLHATTAASMALGGYLNLADGTEYIAIDIYTGASSEIILHELAHSITHIDFINSELSETIADLVTLKTHNYTTHIPTGIHQDLDLYREFTEEYIFNLYQKVCIINEYQFRSFTQKLTHIDLLKIEIEADNEPHMLSCYYLSQLYNSSPSKDAFNQSIDQILDHVMNHYFDILMLPFDQLLEASIKKATK